MVEAVNTSEAFEFLESGDAAIEVALLDVAAAGTRDAFVLAHWLRTERPDIDVVLVGALETIAKKAADLCEAGPRLQKPYHHDQVVDLVKRLRAERGRKT